MRFALASLIFVCACSSKSTPSTDAPPSSNPDAAKTFDAPPGAPDAKPADAKNGFTLHIINQLAWCDITVDGTKYVPPNEPPDMTYAKGTVVHLFGEPESTTFKWGFWLGTDGQNDGGTQDTSQTATITMNADMTVQVCCPFTNGSTCP